MTPLLPSKTIWTQNFWGALFLIAFLNSSPAHLFTKQVLTSDACSVPSAVWPSGATAARKTDVLQLSQNKTFN